jgi:hypothetical protein
VSTEQFTPIQQRAAAALLGAIVGDAAAQTSHWNYDRSAFHAKLRSEGRFETPEFFRSNGFYTVTPGRNSCYGDQIIAIAEHLVNNPRDPLGQTNTAKLVDKLEATFDGASAYGPWPLDPEAPKPTAPAPAPVTLAAPTATLITASLSPTAPVAGRRAAAPAPPVAPASPGGDDGEYDDDFEEVIDEDDN